MKIELTGLEFFAHHGLYDEEQQKGNKFIVDLSATTDHEESVWSDKIEETVNYENLYSIVAQEMQSSSKLLEHVAGRICRAILQNEPLISEISLVISKLDPPLQGPCRASRVTFSLRR